MAHEVEEEVSLGHADHLVRNLDEEAEALWGAQVQPLRNVLTEVLGPRWRVHLESLQEIKNNIYVYQGR